MIQEPKPPSGWSTEAAWFRQLLEWCKCWRVLQIEGYREEQTTSGRKFKRTFKLASPGSSTPASGGGGGAGFYIPGNAYPAGYIAQVLNVISVSGVLVQPGTYVSTQPLPIGIQSPNQVPQYPYPSAGTIYWLYIAPLPIAFQVRSGGNKTIYVAATSPF